MSDKLKDFIDTHRTDFDDLEPRDLLPDIMNGLGYGAGYLATKKLWKFWKWKYWFGASMVIATTAIVTNIVQHQKEIRAEEKRHEFFKNTELPVSNAIVVYEDTNKIKKPLVQTKTEHKDSIVAQKSLPLDSLINTSAAIEKKEEASSGNEQVQTGILSRNDALRSDTIFKGVKRIEVRGEFCNVNVRAHEGNYVSMESFIGQKAGEIVICGWSSYKKKEYYLVYETSDSTLLITINCRTFGERSFVKTTGSSDAYINLKVPAKTDITVLNTSGDVYIAGIESKDLPVKTAFGNIKVESVKADLNLKSGSGDITVSSVTGEVKAESGFGDQRYKDIHGNMTLRSASGDVRVTLLRGDLNVKSTFGDQKLEDITGAIVSASSSGDISIKTLNGNVYANSSFGGQSYESVFGDIRSTASSGDIRINGSKGNLDLKNAYGDIQGKNVRLNGNSEFKTASGNISISLLNPMNELSFDLQTVSGDLMVEKENTRKKDDKELSVGSGPILVRGNTGYGSQIYK
jgi:hypothetical protein